MNYKEKPKNELKEICREKQIKVTGTKQELIDRLQSLEQAITPQVRKDKIFQLMDEADDNALLEKMQGNVVEKYVYEFPQDGKTISGLTAVGVDNACRVSADKKGIAYRVIGMPQITEDESHVRVTVKVGRFAIERDSNGTPREQLMDTAFGSKRQWKKQKLRSGKIVTDNFYYEKAVHKAERNAKRALLPEPFILELIKMYKNGGKVEVIKKQPVIPENKRRMLIAMAGSKSALKGIIKEFGYDSTTQVLKRDFKEIYEAVEANQKQYELPKVLQQDIIELREVTGIALPMPRVEAQWRAKLEKYGNMQEALAAARKGVQDKIAEEKKATEGEII